LRRLGEFGRASISLTVEREKWEERRDDGIDSGGAEEIINAAAFSFSFSSSSLDSKSIRPSSFSDV